MTELSYKLWKTNVYTAITGDFGYLKGLKNLKNTEFSSLQKGLFLYVHLV